MTTHDEPALAARPVPVAVAVAVGMAWAAAFAAHATDHRHLLDHDAVLGTADPSPGAILGYAAAWIVMVAAMMLPSAVPLLRLFAATSTHQDRPALVLAVFAGGYLTVWTAFGWIALAFDTTVHRVVDAWPWLDDHHALVTAAVLALGGAFQFSSLKERCLHTCRHPAAYLLTNYRRGRAAAFRLGWGHGLFCLGCCWALMLVAFAAGMTDLRLMAAFTALMAYEKIGRHGETVARLAGVALLAGAGVVAFHPLV
jgi:predicted metal-binding membrane protein